MSGFVSGPLSKSTVLTHLFNCYSSTDFRSGDQNIIVFSASKDTNSVVMVDQNQKCIAQYPYGMSILFTNEFFKLIS